MTNAAGRTRGFNIGARIRRIFEPFWANPVLVRDLRVRMRGPRTYWQQFFYLLLLGILAAGGYSMATNRGNNGVMSAVEAQQQLQVFYYFIFCTIAVLIALIGPSLTAASITTERQRQTMDLLVTAPMTASQLLIGKLMSSVAFIMLLLFLSVPASALCVILGGATLSDVMRVYVLLALDGLVMAAIGLYFSCAVKNSLPALAWTYITVVGFVIATLIGFGSNRGFELMMLGGNIDPLNALLCINPIVAILVGFRSFDIGPYHLPTWIAAALAALFVIRFLTTAASYKMGNYGGNPIGSLRRQILLVTALIASLATYTVYTNAAMGSAGRYMGGMYSTSVRGVPTITQAPYIAETVMIVLFLVSLLFLPSLMTPAVDDDTPDGTAVTERYNLLKAFSAAHSGALPYYHIWLAVIAACTYGAALACGQHAGERILLTTLYLSATGFFVWSAGRRAVSLTRHLTAARALTFAMTVIISALPLLVLGLTDTRVSNSNGGLLFVFYPLAVLDTPGSGNWVSGMADTGLVVSTLVCYAFGVIIFPFWRVLMPGSVRVRRSKHVRA